MARGGPYPVYNWQAVPVSSVHRQRFNNETGLSKNSQYEGGLKARLSSTFQAAGHRIWISCTNVGLLLVVLTLVAVTLGYAVDNHALLKKLGATGPADPVVNTTKCTIAPAKDPPFASTEFFPTPPARVALYPPQQNWKPFHSQWNCGQGSLSVLSTLLANGVDSYVDAKNYTKYFIDYTDIVREFGDGSGRLMECKRLPNENPSSGTGGPVRCEPSVTWGRPCQPYETAAGTASTASTYSAESTVPESSTIPTTPCATGWHAPSTKEQMARNGHAYCARFCDGFSAARFFNVRTDGQAIACYCLKQCLGSDNPTTKEINGVSGSNEWDVWALNMPGFEAELSPVPLL